MGEEEWCGVSCSFKGPPFRLPGTPLRRPRAGHCLEPARAWVIPVFPGVISIPVISIFLFHSLYILALTLWATFCWWEIKPHPAHTIPNAIVAYIFSAITAFFMSASITQLLLTNTALIAPRISLTSWYSRLLSQIGRPVTIHPRHFSVNNSEEDSGYETSHPTMLNRKGPFRLPPIAWVPLGLSWISWLAKGLDACES